MSAVVAVISDAVDVVVAVTVTAIASALVVFTGGLILYSDDFNDFVLEQLSVIMSLFGIEETDIIETFVNDQRILPDTNLGSFYTELALKHELTQADIIDLFAQNTAAVRDTFSSYYDNGKDVYSHGLPITDFSTEVTPDLTSYVETEYGITITSLVQELDVPTKDEYLTHKLHDSYGYYPQSGLLTYLTESCPVTLTEYNFGTNEYDVHITRGTHKITETTITITPVDATNDNKHTYTTETTTYDTGGAISVVVTEDSNVLIPIGTETGSVVTDDPGVAGSASFTLQVAAFPASRHYIIKYYDSALTTGDWLYWVYETGSGGIPALDSVNTSQSNLELLPIIELRRGTVNINEDKNSVAYLETKAILDLIGLDVDVTLESITSNPNVDSIEDAYIYFGLDIQDDSPLVARMMFDLFEFMFYDDDLGSVNSYQAKVTEGSFNATLMWETQTRVVTQGTIGAIGTHSITTGIDVSVSKQETANQYVTYTMTKLSSATLIDRGTLWGVTVRTCAGADDTIVIPLSMFFVDNLTPIEKLDVFNRALRLSVYSAQITHLEWYETPEFVDLMKIVIITVGVVIAILTSPLGGSPGVTWTSWALGLLYAVGGALAFKKLMESTNNPWLKALYVAIAVVVMASTGVGDTSSLGFFTADQLTTIATDYTEMRMEELAASVAVFTSLAEERQKEIDEAEEAQQGYLSTAVVAELSSSEDESTAYLKSFDLDFYNAIQVQYDWDLAKGSTVYNNMFDYDRYFTVGMVDGNNTV